MLALHLFLVLRFMMLPFLFLDLKLMLGIPYGALGGLAVLSYFSSSFIVTFSKLLRFGHAFYVI